MWPTGGMCRPGDCPDKCGDPFCYVHHGGGDTYTPQRKQVVRFECGPVKGVAVTAKDNVGVILDVVPQTKEEMIELATHLLDTASRMP